MKKNNNYSAKLSTVFLLSITVIIIFSFLLQTSCKKNDQENDNPPGLVHGLFMNSSFRATHNSYSGNKYDGDRGSIIQQLDLGLCYLEIDILCKLMGQNDFIVGHSFDEHKIDHSHGNPSSDLLSVWLTVIKNWSNQNPSHAPIVIAIETKNEIQDHEWDIMNTLVYVIFFGKIIKKSDFNHAKTTYESVKGKIFIVSIPKNDNLPEDEQYIFKAKGYTADPFNDTHVFYTIHAEEFLTPVFVTNARLAKKSIRLAFFKSEYTWLIPNYPSYDNPYYGWYATYCEDHNFVPDFNFDSVTWGGETTFDTGDDVDVAVNASGKLVEVHNLPQLNILVYSTGYLSGQSVTWFPETKPPILLDVGKQPSVAINDNNVVVEVHEATGDNNELHCRVGKLDEASGIISWGPPSNYDDGERPSVAINNENMVIEVHKSENHNELWYNVGKVNHNLTITWGEHHGYRNYTSGKSPSVAIHGNQILEAHNSSDDHMWCIIGLLNVTDKKIDWKDTRGHSTYCYPFEGEGNLYPDVAFNGSCAIEVQQICGTIRSRPGKLSNTVMAWGGARFNAFASEPSVAMNNNNVLLFYKDAWNNLTYRLGTLSD